MMILGCAHFMWGGLEVRPSVTSIVLEQGVCSNQK